MAKKKILLLSDDLRMSSGVGTVSREFVMGTMKHYDWAQLGGAIKHPESGKVVDMNEAVRKETGIKDAYLKIYPISGYGNQEILRQLLTIEKPDAIMHYTDPRFWKWLYEMEAEVRTRVPIFYYNIWDDLPYPKWNEFFYESCDLIMNISKQTVNIVKNVWKKNPPEDWQVTYIPHGMNEKQFRLITELDVDDWPKLQEFKNKMCKGKDYEFIIFWNNRNIRRKLPGDVIMSYKHFCDQLPKEQADKCLLIMHTSPVDENGTDLVAVHNSVCPEYNVIFSHKKVDTKHLNYLYNLADIQINIASNEGFGLGTCEALMSETPIIVNVTGGLQDQCGFSYKGKHLTSDDYSWVHSLHDDKKWKDNPDLTWGKWVKPVWPSNRSLQGSPPTPYIFDDRCRWDDVGDMIKSWYDTSPEDRKECGRAGREYVLRDDTMMSSRRMCERFIEDMDTAFVKWKPKKRFRLHNVLEEIS